MSRCLAPLSLMPFKSGSRFDFIFLAFQAPALPGSFFTPLSDFPGFGGQVLHTSQAYLLPGLGMLCWPFNSIPQPVPPCLTNLNCTHSPTGVLHLVEVLPVDSACHQMKGKKCGSIPTLPMTAGCQETGIYLLSLLPTTFHLKKVL